MRFLWGVLCRKAIVEEKSGKLSIIDIPEVLVLNEPVPEYPNPEGKIGLTFGFTYAAVFWYDEDVAPELEVRLFWRTPDGTKLPLGDHKAPARNSAKNTSVRFLLQVEKVEFRGPGAYQLELEARNGKKKWQKVSSYPLLLRATPDAATTAP